MIIDLCPLPVNAGYEEKLNKNVLLLLNATNCCDIISQLYTNSNIWKCSKIVSGHGQTLKSALLLCVLCLV